MKDKTMVWLGVSARGVALELGEYPDQRPSFNPSDVKSWLQVPRWFADSVLSSWGLLAEAAYAQGRREERLEFWEGFSESLDGEEEDRAY